MKIWARLIVNGKNVKDTLYENKLPLTFANYEIMLRDIADLLDIPCPISMKLHFNHLKKFNVHRYKEDDFVESLNYDWLEIENF